MRKTIGVLALVAIVLCVGWAIYAKAASYGLPDSVRVKQTGLCDVVAPPDGVACFDEKLAYYRVEIQDSSGVLSGKHWAWSLTVPTPYTVFDEEFLYFGHVMTDFNWIKPWKLARIEYLINGNFVNQIANCTGNTVKPKHVQIAIWKILDSEYMGPRGNGINCISWELIRLAQDNAGAEDWDRCGPRFRLVGIQTDTPWSAAVDYVMLGITVQREIPCDTPTPCPTCPTCTPTPPPEDTPTPTHTPTGTRTPPTKTPTHTPTATPTPEETPPPEVGACSPGFWKKDDQAWPVYHRNDDFAVIFGVVPSASLTLGEAIKGNEQNASPLDDPSERQLAFHATAALLNSVAGIGYPYSSSEVIAKVQAAYASGNFGPLTSYFNSYYAEPDHCPLDRQKTLYRSGGERR